MPRISEFYGIAVCIYYRDHNPPYFHAIYGGSEAVIDIRSGAILDGKFPRRAGKLVAEWCDLHRDELLADWALANPLRHCQNHCPKRSPEVLLNCPATKKLFASVVLATLNCTPDQSS